MLTPVPWKLLSDVSIWTQNFPWIPQPSHGPVETKNSVCTLCAGGCGIRVRMAAKVPVGVAGVSSHPLTKGALCPLAFAAHQLNWHPRTIARSAPPGARHPGLKRRRPLKKLVTEGPLAIVDGRPGRAASSLFESFARKRQGSYRIVFDREHQALTPYAAWSGVPVTELGYDVRNARTIVSFGTPLLDGWGMPGQFTRLWSEREEQSQRTRNYD